MNQVTWMSEKHLGKPKFVAAAAQDFLGKPFEVFAPDDLSPEHRETVLQAFHLSSLNKLGEEPEEENYRIKIVW